MDSEEVDVKSSIVASGWPFTGISRLSIEAISRIRDRLTWAISERFLVEGLHGSSRSARWLHTHIAHFLGDVFPISVLGGSNTGGLDVLIPQPVSEDARVSVH